MAGPVSSPQFQSITLQDSLEGPQPSAALNFFAISMVAYKALLYCIIKQLSFAAIRTVYNTAAPCKLRME